MNRSNFAIVDAARFSTLSVAFDVLCVGLVVEVALGLGWFDGSVFCCVTLLRGSFVSVSLSWLFLLSLTCSSFYRASFVLGRWCGRVMFGMLTLSRVAYLCGLRFPVKQYTSASRFLWRPYVSLPTIYFCVSSAWVE